LTNATRFTQRTELTGTRSKMTTMPPNRKRNVGSTSFPCAFPLRERLVTFRGAALRSDAEERTTGGLSRRCDRYTLLRSPGKAREDRSEQTVTDETRHTTELQLLRGSAARRSCGYCPRSRLAPRQNPRRCILPRSGE
jgi:hypothetical protein